MAKQSAKSTSKGNASAHTAHAELAEDLKKQGAAVFTAESADGNSEEALKCMAHPRACAFSVRCVWAVCRRWGAQRQDRRGSGSGELSPCAA